MARYRGPKTKIARRFREPIFGPSKALERKKYGPGMHGPSKRRRKQSEYAIQLMEKQFRKMFVRASTLKGVTGENLLMLCESRLDNVVFRLGLAPTRDAARQLVSHKHITLNGEVANIPSITLRPGDKVGVRERSKSLSTIQNALASTGAALDWVSFDRNSMEGTFVNSPKREQIPENIKEQLIVELYSK